MTRVIIVLAAAVLALPGTAIGQQTGHSHSHGATQAQASGGVPYTIRLADLMLFQQIRHDKLWFAGAARHWDLASFALHELKEGFEAVEKSFPKLGDTPLAPMAEAVIEKEIAEVEKAIEAHDRKAFIAAFDKLTQSCNACHQATDHAFIAIKQPTTPHFTNQRFTPPGRR